MTRKLFQGIAFALLAGIASAVSADDMDQVRERISTALTEINPDLSIERIEPSPVEGLYQVLVAGQVLYVTGDGRYLLQGDMLDLQRRQSVSEPLRGGMRLEKLRAHGTENMIVYPAQGEREHTITVFTDIDCPYCRRMHSNMESYTSLGIEVRYIQMPRAGEGSESYHKAVSVWCADDRKAALDRAKSGASMERRSCDNPVSAQLQLARELGVSATPTIFTETGVMHRGLVEAEQLKAMLDEEN
ncbi:MAG: DsbC family protein [Aquisalimonadaceae bacterium]